MNSASFNEFMNKYKDTNHAMAVENQKLRQELALLKNEVLCLNRQLMAEQQNSRIFKQRMQYLVLQISKGCNDAVQGLREEIADLNDGESKERRKSSAHRKTENLRRSILLVQPIFRQDQPKDSGDEESPVEDIESRRQFIQIRRRKCNERSFNDETEKDLGSQETDENILPMRPQFDDNEGYTPHSVSVIQEENTKDFSVEDIESRRQFIQIRRRICNERSFNDETEKDLESQETDESILPMRPQFDENEGYTQHLVSVIPEENTKDFSVEDIESRRQFIQVRRRIYNERSFNDETEKDLGSQETDESDAASSLHSFQESSSQSSQTDDYSEYLPEIPESYPSSARRPNRTIHSTFMELTNLHAFSAASLACSTPRKHCSIIETRDCFVRLKKLTPCDLIKWGIKIDEQNNDKCTNNKCEKATRPREEKRKMMSPKPCQIRISVARVSSPQVKTKSFSSFNANCSRPRRNAAPENLQEPSLRRKMRRNI